MPSFPWLIVALTTMPCAPPSSDASQRGESDPLGSLTAGSTSEGTAGPRADVVAARATGESGDLTVFVTIRSDETGCDQYADWWEVVTPEGELVTRRVLAHSHPDDNPFERSEAGVDLSRTEPVVIRAHMAPGGYVGDALEGSFDSGFTPAALPDGWFGELQLQEPLPTDCLF